MREPSGWEKRRDLGLGTLRHCKWKKITAWGVFDEGHPGISLGSNYSAWESRFG